MPKIKSKSKAVGLKSSKSLKTASAQDTICDGCCSTIVEGEHEAIQCEGSCQKWYHRLCAGVSKYHYDMLADSPNPFICWMCSDILRRAVIQELQQELATLKRDHATELETNRSEISALKKENAALE